MRGPRWPPSKQHASVREWLVSTPLESGTSLLKGLAIDFLLVGQRGGGLQYLKSSAVEIHTTSASNTNHERAALKLEQ